jgi:hypothetical protein
MSNLVNLTYAPISITFDKEFKQRDAYKREFDLLEQHEDDPVGHWLRVAKAKGEAKDTDKLLLELIVEMHRKIDQLSQEITGKAKKFISLEFDKPIVSIDYEHFKLKDEILEVDVVYYGRITMPTFPRRDIPVYFKAIDKSIANIKLMHQRDRDEWDAYVAARQRSAIREAKREKFEWE